METLEISRWSKYSEKPERSKDVWVRQKDNTRTYTTIIEKEKGNEEAGYITHVNMFVNNHKPSYEGQKIVRIHELEFGRSSGHIAVNFGNNNTVYMNREQAVELMSQLTEIL